MEAPDVIPMNSDMPTGPDICAKVLISVEIHQVLIKEETKSMDPVPKRKKARLKCGN